MSLTKAITQKPGKNFAAGITNSGLGMPDLELALEQHNAYCLALKNMGLDLITLEANDSFPDACFVEDTAIITSKGAMITRPGDPSRRGETAIVREILYALKSLAEIEAPGTLDGGDVLNIGNHYYIGLSQRTNRSGASQLATWLENQGHSTSLVPVTQVLHLKTGITSACAETVICIPAFAKFVSPIRSIIVSAEEAYAANCLSVNDNLIVPAGYPLAENELRKTCKASEIIPLQMSEFQKMDGGLTCLSLLF